MVEEKEIAGPVLGVVGGLVIMIFSIDAAYGAYVGNIGPAVETGLLGGLFGFLILVLALGGSFYPEYHRVLGGLVIFFAVLSLVNLVEAGFILAVLGGTCLIVFGPDDALGALSDPTTPPYYAPVHPPPPTAAKVEPAAPSADKNGRTHLACPSCGFVNPIQATICLSCNSTLRP